MTNIDPTKTALLLMDFQNGIVSMISEPDFLLRQAQRALEIARRAEISIVYVRVAFTPQDKKSISLRNKSFSSLAKESDRMNNESQSTQIHDSLQPEPHDIVVTKTRVGAFSTTNLATLLNGRDINTLILTGIATSGVVLSTIRDAADHDFQLYVLADCCADRDPETHRVLTEKVFPRQAEIISVDALAELLAGHVN